MNLLTLMAASWLSVAEAPAPPPPALSIPLLVAQAGGPPPRGDRQPPPRPDPEQLANDLALDPEQAREFVAIVSEQRQQHDAVHERQRENREAADLAHQAIDEETYVRLSSVLSAEQLARFHARRPPPPRHLEQGHRQRQP